MLARQQSLSDLVFGATLLVSQGVGFDSLKLFRSATRKVPFMSEDNGRYPGPPSYSPLRRRWV